MLHLTHKLPNDKKFFFACSGGIDSMAALHFLARGRRYPHGIIYIHHNSGEYADKAMQFIQEYCKYYTSNIHVKRVTGTAPKGESQEAWWRAERYRLFQEVLDETGHPDFPIVLAHQLNDCLEQYVLSTFVRPRSYKLINYEGMSNTIRPFRTWSRDEINSYAFRHGVTWIEDPSNCNIKFQRNYIRHQVIPHLLALNPGLLKQVKNMIINEGS